MPTTVSTGRQYDSRGNSWLPKVKRIVDSVAFATGTTTTLLVETIDRSRCRVTAHVTAIGSGSTLTVKLFTGASTGSLVVNVDTSTGAAQLAMGSTGVYTKVFPGLHRYTRINVAEVGGTGATTGLAVDAEFLE